MNLEYNIKIEKDDELDSLREEQQAVQFLLDSNRDQQFETLEDNQPKQQSEYTVKEEQSEYTIKEEQFESLNDNHLKRKFEFATDEQQFDSVGQQQFDPISESQQIEELESTNEIQQQNDLVDNQQTEHLLTEDRKSEQHIDYLANDQSQKTRSIDNQIVKTTIDELPKLISSSTVHTLSSNSSITPQLPKLISTTKLKQSKLDGLSSKIIYDSLDENDVNNLLNNYSENSSIVNCDNKTLNTTTKTMYPTDNDINLLDNYSGNYFFDNYNLTNEHENISMNNNLINQDDRSLNNANISQWPNNHHLNYDLSVGSNQSAANLDSWFYLDKNILRYDETDPILNDCIQQFDTNTEQNFIINNNYDNLLRDDLIEDHKPTTIELNNYSNQYNLNQQYLHHYTSNNHLNDSTVNQISNYNYNSLDYHQLQSLTINSNNQTPYHFSATTNTTYSNGSTNLLPTSHYHVLPNINNSNSQFSNNQHYQLTVTTQNNYSKPTVVNASDLINKSTSINSTIKSTKSENSIDDQNSIKNLKEEPANQLSLSTNSQNSDSLNNDLSPATTINIEKKIITLQEAANVRLEKVKLERSNGMKIYYFKCSLCTYQTNTSQSMKDHLYCIHCKAKNNYKCNICQQTFGWKNNAQRHMRRKHKIEDQTTKREAIITLI